VENKQSQDSGGAAGGPRGHLGTASGSFQAFPGFTSPVPPVGQSTGKLEAVCPEVQDRGSVLPGS
jgi:hypothetical protein